MVSMSWPCGPLSRLDSTDGHTRRLSLGATDCLLEQCFGVHTKQFVLIIFDYVERKIQCRLRISKKKYHTCSSGLATTCNINVVVVGPLYDLNQRTLVAQSLGGFCFGEDGLGCDAKPLDTWKLTYA